VLSAQKLLLRAGIMNLVMYARAMSHSKLRALGASHSRAALDNRPELYDLCLDALLMADAEHDRDSDAETRHAWRDVM
ncbi:globin, partial [Pseudomonas aeruginosa]